MQISAVKIEKFKRLSSLEIALSDITVLIGGNNSGKSSLLQGVHLTITTLQSAITQLDVWKFGLIALSHRGVAS